MMECQIVRADGNYDTVTVYTVDDFPFERLSQLSIIVKKKEYICDFMTFDIETTSITDCDTPYGFMYHWQAQVGSFICIGRRWEEWRAFMIKLVNVYGLSHERRLVIYVHNLAFEFQFVREFLLADHGEIEVFAANRRKPIKVTTASGLEFRCSYKLTNMSLEKAVLNEKGVLHIKAKGDLDYRQIRTADTALTPVELGYCISDVVSLHEMIECRMRNENDNLHTIPLTSTSYVRRDVRSACRADKTYRNFFTSLHMDSKIYGMLKDSARGGNTHANRKLAGRIIHDVDSYDFRSDYPAQMLLKQFPMTAFQPYGVIETMEEYEKVASQYACLFYVHMTNVQVREHIAMPYIPTAKCLKCATAAEDSNITLRQDNGRVLSSPYLCLCVTEIDFAIIREQYAFDKVAFEDMHIAKYGLLPKPIRASVLKYFADKCELKWKIKHSKGEDKENYQYLYAKSKNRLNGIFGMCYTDPVRDSIEINENGEWSVIPPDIEKALAQYQKSRNSFLYYPWGVWVTAHARAFLERLIKACGTDTTIYSDTDSVKCITGYATGVEAFNAEIIAECEKMGAYYDCHGERIYIGIAEKENDVPIAMFKTLGAKKYAYVDGEGLHITVSGVSKAKGKSGKTLAVEEMETIKNFREGFVFNKAGGLELHYNDGIGIQTIKVNNCEMQTASNVCMMDSTYTLGITPEYSELLSENM